MDSKHKDDDKENCLACQRFILFLFYFIEITYYYRTIIVYSYCVKIKKLHAIKIYFLL